MKLLRDLLDQAEPLFHKGGPLEKGYALYEAADTFLYTPGRVTNGPTHVRDSIDLKRTMITVVVALVPCIFMALWNTGYQANLAMQEMGLSTAGGWRGVVMDIVTRLLPLISSPIHGALYFLPVASCVIWSVAFGRDFLRPCAGTRSMRDFSLQVCSFP